MVRCAKILESGKQCKREAVEGSKYCFQHKGSRTPKKSPGRKTPRKSPRKSPRSPRKSPKGKRAPSAYNRFVGTVFAELKGTRPPKEIISEAARRWKGMSTSGKAKY